MRNFIPKAIRVLAYIFFFGGILLFFVCKHNAWDAGIGYYTRDKEAVAMWNFLSIQCIITSISSVFIFGLSYIVEAACRYLDKSDNEEKED